jgi:hypothetical protein
LDRVLSKHGEGLIIKNPESTYMPAERHARHWCKLKADYMPGMTDTLDLLVVGFWRGKGVAGRLGSVATLQCATVDEQGRVLAFCKVGSGFGRDEVMRLSGLLEPFISTSDSHVIEGKTKADSYVDLSRQRVIIEVRGLSIIDSSQFPTNLTLRSPRFVRLRTDKIRRMQRHNRGHMARGVKRPKIEAETVGSQEATEAAVKDVFKGAQVYVHDGDDVTSKSAAQQLVTEYGGHLTEHPTADTAFIIAGSADQPGLRLKNLIREHPACAVYSLSWLRRHE